MRKTVLLLSSMTVAMLLASAITLVMPKEQARAAFPGINGKIVFERDPDGYRGPKDPEIYTIRFDGTNLTPLTNNNTQDTAPTFSADGKRIVFSGGDRRAFDSYRADLFVMRANGSDKTLVTDESKIPGASIADDLEPAFSPNGLQIVFERHSPGAYGNDMYKIGVSGRNLTPLEGTSDDDYGYGDPAWSPNGKKIAYAYSSYEDPVIKFMRPDGSYIGHCWIQGHDPDWSPDGSKIVATQGGSFILKAPIANPDPVSGCRESNWKIIAGDGYDPALSPGVGPNGGKVVFTSDRDGDEDLYVANANGTDHRQLTNLPGDESSPDWQPVQ